MACGSNVCKSLRNYLQKSNEYTLAWGRRVRLCRRDKDENSLFLCVFSFWSVHPDSIAQRFPGAPLYTNVDL